MPSPQSGTYRFCQPLLNEVIQIQKKWWILASFGVMVSSIGLILTKASLAFGLVCSRQHCHWSLALFVLYLQGSFAPFPSARTPPASPMTCTASRSWSTACPTTWNTATAGPSSAPGAAWASSWQPEGSASLTLSLAGPRWHSSSLAGTPRYDCPPSRSPRSVARPRSRGLPRGTEWRSHQDSKHNAVSDIPACCLPAVSGGLILTFPPS